MQCPPTYITCFAQEAETRSHVGQVGTGGGSHMYPSAQSPPFPSPPSLRSAPKTFFFFSKPLQSGRKHNYQATAPQSGPRPRMRKSKSMIFSCCASWYACVVLLSLGVMENQIKAVLRSDVCTLLYYTYYTTTTPPPLHPPPPTPPS